MNRSSATCRILLACAVFSLALPTFADTTAPTPTIPQPVKYTVNGYVQGRYTDDFGQGSKNGSFDVTRAYINLRADVNQHISAVMMVSGTPKVGVKEAYGEYAFNPSVKARLGLSRIPFGYEVQVSSSRLITLERSQAVSELLAKEFTFDRGLYAYYTPKSSPLSLSAGITNGNFTDAKSADDTLFPRDTNNTKNIVARVGYAIPGGQVGVSAYIGKHPNGETMDRYDAELEATWGALTVQSEVITGKGSSLTPSTYSGDHHALGGYAILAYRKPGTQGQPYIRAEAYDPDTDSGDNSYKSATVGYNHYLTDNSKLTLEYRAINDNLHPHAHGTLGAQYQVSF